MALVPGRVGQPGDGMPVNRLMRQTVSTHTLTPIQDRFVLEYLIDLDGAQAAIRAGYEPKNAAPQAARLMKAGHPVQEAVVRAMAARSARVGINVDRVMRELGRIAFGDPRHALNEDGTLKAPSTLDDDAAATVAGIKTRRIVELNADTGKMQQAEVQEIKYYDKLGALDKIMRHLGMYNDKLDVTVTSLATRLDEAFRRTSSGPVIDVVAEEADEDAEQDEIEQQEDVVRQAQFGAKPDLDEETKRMLGL